MTSEYKPEELKKAAQEIAVLTPEEYLDLVETLRKYQGDAMTNLPEAPASLNFVGYDQLGFRIQFTLRSVEEVDLLNRYDMFTKFLKERGVTPTGAGTYAEREPYPDEPATSAAGSKKAPVEERITSPIDVDLTGSEIDRFEVDTINRQVTTNGKDYLLIKGGPWTQYGWKAWPEVVPASHSIENLKIGTPVAPPEDMQIAYADKEKKKIVAFARRS